jgi:hypothetical protein
MKNPKQKGPTESPYIKLRAEMLSSQAWRDLTPAAKKVIERLIIEHIQHAGKDNGRLICTYPDFERHGIRPGSIAPAIRLCVKLGFVVVTQQGRRTPDHNWPSHYRLTFLPTADANPTDEWKHFVAIKKSRKMQKPTYKNVASTAYENVASTDYENVGPGILAD